VHQLVSSSTKCSKKVLVIILIVNQLIKQCTREQVVGFGGFIEAELARN
jgi:hypothetical protein